MRSRSELGLALLASLALAVAACDERARRHYAAPPPETTLTLVIADAMSKLPVTEEVDVDLLGADGAPFLGLEPLPGTTEPPTRIRSASPVTLKLAPGVAFPTRLVARATLPGYAQSALRITLQGSGVHTARMLLVQLAAPPPGVSVNSLPTGAPTSPDGTTTVPIELASDSGEVSIPAGSQLQLEDGTPAEGPVAVSMVAVDTTDPNLLASLPDQRDLSTTSAGGANQGPMEMPMPEGGMPSGGEPSGSEPQGKPRVAAADTGFTQGTGQLLLPAVCTTISVVDAQGRHVTQVETGVKVKLSMSKQAVAFWERRPLRTGDSLNIITTAADGTPKYSGTALVKEVPLPAGARSQGPWAGPDEAIPAVLARPTDPAASPLPAAEPLAACRPDETMCTGQCANLKTDYYNCGTCGNRCADGQVCNAGTCAGDCPNGPGLTECNAGCIDLATDARNCGDCGRPCGEGQFCSDGTCFCKGFESVDPTQVTDTCPNPDPTKPPLCKNFMIDENNCGGCGNRCASPKVCLQGTCRCGRLKPNYCGTAAGPGTCVDFQADPMNCGGCGRAVGANQICEAGVAKTCTGKTACNNECIDTMTDGENCGRCGNKCEYSLRCMNGACPMVTPVESTFTVQQTGSICLGTLVPANFCYDRPKELPYQRVILVFENLPTVPVDAVIKMKSYAKTYRLGVDDIVGSGTRGTDRRTGQTTWSHPENGVKYMNGDSVHLARYILRRKADGKPETCGTTTACSVAGDECRAALSNGRNNPYSGIRTRENPERPIAPGELCEVDWGDDEACMYLERTRANCGEGLTACNPIAACVRPMAPTTTTSTERAAVVRMALFPPKEYVDVLQPTIDIVERGTSSVLKSFTVEDVKRAVGELSDYQICGSVLKFRIPNTKDSVKLYAQSFVSCPAASSLRTVDVNARFPSGQGTGTGNSRYPTFGRAILGDLVRDATTLASGTRLAPQFDVLPGSMYPLFATYTSGTTTLRTQGAVTMGTLDYTTVDELVYAGECGASSIPTSSLLVEDLARGVAPGASESQAGGSLKLRSRVAPPTNYSQTGGTMNLRSTLSGGGN